MTKRKETAVVGETSTPPADPTPVVDAAVPTDRAPDASTPPVAERPGAQEAPGGSEGAVDPGTPASDEAPAGGPLGHDAAVAATTVDDAGEVLTEVEQRQRARAAEIAARVALAPDAEDVPRVRFDEEGHSLPNVVGQ